MCLTGAVIRNLRDHGTILKSNLRVNFVESTYVCVEFMLVYS